MANTFVKAQEWASVLQSQLRESFIGKEIANTRFEGDFDGADTVNFRRQAKLSTLPLATASSKVTVQALNMTNETFTLNNREHISFEIANEDMKELNVSPESEQILNGVEAYARKWDDAIFAEYANAGLVLQDGDMETASNGGTTNSIALSKSNIYDAITAIGKKMDEANIPSNDRWVVFSPKEKQLLLKCPELVRSTQLGDKVVTGGYVGEIDGFKIMFSNRIVTASSIKHCLAGQGKPIDFAANIKPKVEMTPSEYRDSFAALFKTMSKYGTKVFTSGAERLMDIQVKV
jgi:hypothetical protein